MLKVVDIKQKVIAETITATKKRTFAIYSILFFFLSGFCFIIHNSPLHRHLDISRAITAKSSPLHIVTAGLQPLTFGFRAQVANHYLQALSLGKQHVGRRWEQTTELMRCFHNSNKV